MNRWQDYAACKEADTNLFYPPDSGGRLAVSQKRIREALAYCAACPVRAECGDHGHRYEKQGIWGGVIQDIRAGETSGSGVCIIDGCYGRQKARGFCTTHYRRWKKGVVGAELAAPARTRT